MLKGLENSHKGSTKSLLNTSSKSGVSGCIETMSFYADEMSTQGSDDDSLQADPIDADAPGDWLLRPTSKIGSQLSSQIFGSMFEDFTQQIAAFALSKHSEQFAGLGQQLGATLISQLGWSTEVLLDHYRTAIAPLLAQLASPFRGVWPGNLEGLHLDVNEMKTLMVDEGLPIAWVPRTSILRSVLAAKTAQQRRAVYGRRWVAIVDDCEAMLDRTTSTAVEPFKLQALKSIAGLRSGHHELAQAFSAATLDTTVGYVFSTRLARRHATNVEHLGKLDERPVREFFAVAQLMGVHLQYRPSDGDPIPRTFNRHASIHGVSTVQYSRLNSVLALAHLTSFIWFIELSTTRRPRR
ncbi:MAG: hypothetical protein QOE16_2338 [Microbacteriaceae bacterium]|nr:hypothetical protein [Microbacteriaceae bacterium]